MNSELITEVTEMVSKFTGVSPRELTLETTLFHDLGIDGDDAVDFFTEFEAGFHVDLSDFKISKYFGSETSGLLSSMIIWLQGVWTGDYHQAASVEPITLCDLIESAQARRWIKS